MLICIFLPVIVKTCDTSLSYSAFMRIKVVYNGSSIHASKSKPVIIFAICFNWRQFWSLWSIEIALSSARFIFVITWLINEPKLWLRHQFFISFVCFYIFLWAQVIWHLTIFASTDDSFMLAYLWSFDCGPLYRVLLWVLVTILCSFTMLRALRRCVLKRHEFTWHEFIDWVQSLNVSLQEAIFVLNTIFY